jgi:hypothetical protein
MFGDHVFVDGSFFGNGLGEHATFGTFARNLHFFGHSFVANQFGFFGFITIIVAEQAAARRETESGYSK